MNHEENSRLAKVWIKQSETHWAYEKLLDILNESHDKAWPVIFEIAKNSCSLDVLGMLAAGPLEDILCQDSDCYLELIGEQAGKCENFRIALLLGIRITGKGSGNVKKYIDRLHEKAISEGWHPNL